MSFVRRHNLRRLHLPPRIAEFRSRFARARHFRGHGVHSPFVYGLVRRVFMAHRLLTEEHPLYDALRAAGVSERRARELQNLMTHCGYRSFAIDEDTAELRILTPRLHPATCTALVRRAAAAGATVVLLDPYADTERRRLCGSMVATHRSTSVDNRGYLLLFNDRRLPKQHFRI